MGKANDVVYILKNGPMTDELRYSLRSLKNFPHSKVWFFGGNPEGLKPDRAVEIQQTGRSKWEKVKNTLYQVCSNDEITPDFWLFNDDFFCMKPCSGMPAYYNGSLYERIVELEHRYHGRTSYSKNLRETADLLDSEGLGVLNYAVHIPMLIDRAKALVVLEEFKTCPMFRSLYGNSCEVGGIDRKDVKIYSIFDEPDHDADWLSTTNASFNHGKAGEFIREQFKEKCEYER